MREEEFQARLKSLGVFTDSMLDNLIRGQSRDELLDGLRLFASDEDRAAAWRRERQHIMELRGVVRECPTSWGFRARGFAHGDRPEAWWRYEAPGAPVDREKMSAVERALFLRDHHLLEKGEEQQVLAGPLGRAYAARIENRAAVARQPPARPYAGY